MDIFQAAERRAIRNDLEYLFLGRETADGEERSGSPVGGRRSLSPDPAKGRQRGSTSVSPTNTSTAAWAVKKADMNASGASLQREFNRLRGTISDSASTMVNKQRDIIRLFHRFELLASDTVRRVVAHWLVATDLTAIPLSLEVSDLNIHVLGEVSPLGVPLAWEHEEPFKVAHREVAARIDAAAQPHLGATLHVPLCAAVHYAGFDFFIEASIGLTKDSQLGGVQKPITDQFRAIPTGEGVPHVNRQTEYVTRAVGLSMGLKHRAANSNAFLPTESRLDMGPDGDYYVRGLARARPPLLERGVDVAAALIMGSISGGTDSPPPAPTADGAKDSSSMEGSAPLAAVGALLGASTTPYVHKAPHSGVPLSPSVKRITHAGSCPPPWSSLVSAPCHRLRERSEYRLLPGLLREYSLGTALAPDCWVGKHATASADGEVLEVNRLLHLVAVPRLANFLLVLDRVACATRDIALPASSTAPRLDPAYAAEVGTVGGLRALFRDAMVAPQANIPMASSSGNAASEGVTTRTDRQPQQHIACYSPDAIEERLQSLLLFSSANPNFRLTCARVKDVFHSFGVNLRLLGRVVELLEDAIVNKRRLVDVTLHQISMPSSSPASSYVPSTVPPPTANPRLPIPIPANAADFYALHPILKTLRAEMAARAVAYVVRRQWKASAQLFFATNFKEDEEGVMRRIKHKAAKDDPLKGVPVAHVFPSPYHRHKGGAAAVDSPPSSRRRQRGTIMFGDGDEPLIDFNNNGDEAPPTPSTLARQQQQAVLKQLLGRSVADCTAIVDKLVGAATVSTLTHVSGDFLSAVNGTDEALWRGEIIPMIQHKFGYQWTFYREYVSQSNVMGGVKSDLSTGSRVRVRHIPTTAGDQWARVNRCPAPQPRSLTKQPEARSWGLASPPPIRYTDGGSTDKGNSNKRSTTTAPTNAVTTTAMGGGANKKGRVLVDARDDRRAIVDALTHYAEDGENGTHPSTSPALASIVGATVPIQQLIDMTVAQVYSERIENHEFLTDDANPDGFLVPDTDDAAATDPWGEIGGSAYANSPMRIGERQDCRIVQRVCALCSIRLEEDAYATTASGITATLDPITKGLKTRSPLPPTQLRLAHNGIVEPIITSLRDQMRAHRKLWGSTAEYRQLPSLYLIGDLYRIQSKFAQSADVCKKFCDVLAHDNGHNFIGLVDANLRVSRALISARNEKAALAHAQHAVQLATEHTGHNSQLLTRALLTLLDLYEAFEGTSATESFTKKKIDLAMRLQPLCSGENGAVSVARIEARAALLQLQHAIATLKQKEAENVEITAEIEEYKRAVAEQANNAANGGAGGRKSSLLGSRGRGTSLTANSGKGIGSRSANDNPQHQHGRASILSSPFGVGGKLKEPRRLYKLSVFRAAVAEAEASLAGSISEALQSQGLDDELVYFIVKYTAYTRRIELLPILCNAVSSFVHISSPHFMHCVTALVELLLDGVRTLCRDAAVHRASRALLLRQQEQQDKGEGEGEEEGGVSTSASPLRRLGGGGPSSSPSPLLAKGTATNQSFAMYRSMRASVRRGAGGNDNSNGQSNAGPMGGSTVGLQSLLAAKGGALGGNNQHQGGNGGGGAAADPDDTALEPTLALLYGLFNDPRWRDEKAYDLALVSTALRGYASIVGTNNNNPFASSRNNSSDTAAAGGSSRVSSVAILAGKGASLSDDDEGRGVMMERSASQETLQKRASMWQSMRNLHESQKKEDRRKSREMMRPADAPHHNASSSSDDDDDLFESADMDATKRSLADTFATDEAFGQTVALVEEGGDEDEDEDGSRDQTSKKQKKSQRNSNKASTNTNNNKKKRIPLGLQEQLFTTSSVNLFRRWLRALVRSVPIDMTESPWEWDPKVTVGPYCTLTSKVSELCEICPVIGLRVCLAIGDELELSQQQIHRQQQQQRAVAKTVPSLSGAQADSTNLSATNKSSSSATPMETIEGTTMGLRVAGLVEDVAVSYRNPLAADPWPVVDHHGVNTPLYSPLAAPFLHRIVLLLWAATVKAMVLEGHLVPPAQSAYVVDVDPRRLPRFELAKPLFAFTVAIRHLMQCLRGIYGMHIAEHLGPLQALMAEEGAAMVMSGGGLNAMAARKASIFGAAEFSSPPPPLKSGDAHSLHSSTPNSPHATSGGGGGGSASTSPTQRRGSGGAANACLAPPSAVAFSDHVPACMQTLMAHVFMGVEVNMTDRQLCHATPTNPEGLAAPRGNNGGPIAGRRKSQLTSASISSPNNSMYGGGGASPLSSVATPQRRDLAVGVPPNPSAKGGIVWAGAAEKRVYAVGLPQGVLVRLHLDPFPPTLATGPNTTTSGSLSARYGNTIASPLPATAQYHQKASSQPSPQGAVGSIAAGIAIVPKHTLLEGRIEVAHRLPPHLVLAYEWPMATVMGALKAAVLDDVAPLLHVLGQKYPLQREELWASYGAFLTWLLEEEQRLYTPRYCPTEVDRRLGQHLELFSTARMAALVGRVAMGALSGQAKIEHCQSQHLLALMGEAMLTTRAKEKAQRERATAQSLSYSSPSSRRHQSEEEVIPPVNSLIRNAWRRKRQRTFVNGPPIPTSTAYEPDAIPQAMTDSDVDRIERALEEEEGNVWGNASAKQHQQAMMGALRERVMQEWEDRCAVMKRRVRAAAAGEEEATMGHLIAASTAADRRLSGSTSSNLARAMAAVKVSVLLGGGGGGAKGKGGGTGGGDNAAASSSMNSSMNHINNNSSGGLIPNAVASAMKGRLAPIGGGGAGAPLSPSTTAATATTAAKRATFGTSLASPVVTTVHHIAPSNDSDGDGDDGKEREGGAGGRKKASSSSSSSPRKSLLSPLRGTKAVVGGKMPPLIPDALRGHYTNTYDTYSGAANERSISTSSTSSKRKEVGLRVLEAAPRGGGGGPPIVALGTPHITVEWRTPAMAPPAAAYLALFACPKDGGEGRGAAHLPPAKFVTSAALQTVKGLAIRKTQGTASMACPGDSGAYVVALFHSGSVPILTSEVFIVTSV